MPTHQFQFPTEKKKRGRKMKKKEAYVIGPHGEKRPMSDTANAVRIMEIATGLREEEYVEPKMSEKISK